MPYDIEGILSGLGIDYVTSGSNVKKGNINVACPFCGDDPSHHLGVDPETGFWGCWRNRNHRGRKLYRLIAALGGFSFQQAAQIVGEAGNVEFDSEFDRLISEGIRTEDEYTPPVQEGVESLAFQIEMRPLNELIPASRRFLYYLMENRKYNNLLDAVSVASYYRLRYAVSGRWKDRIIIPVYMEGDLVTWTARSIYPDAQLRYRSLERENSVMNIKHTLFNYDHARRHHGNALVVVEGPMDAIRLDYFGRKYGVRSVALFNTTAEQEQIYWLHRIKDLYEVVVVLFDSGMNEMLQATQLADELHANGFVNVVVGELPKGTKDPGELTRVQVRHLCEKLTEAVTI